MSGQPLVSVIVPVYNVEPYVGQCIESLIGQTLEELEIILVNDGSTDGSLGLLRKAEAIDSRVRVIDKPNGGYGAAVNRGLDEARGKYVAIAEPDDFVDAHMYEDLYGAARQADGAWADVVKGSYWNYYDGNGAPGGEPRISASNLMNSMPKASFCSTVRESPEVLFHHPSIWSAIYRRAFLAEKGIRMIEPRGAGWADNPWFYETLLQAERFVWVPAAYYYYRQTNPNASSKRLDASLPFDRLRDIRALYERLRVTDKQLIACLYNRTFTYIGILAGKFGYDESDGEFRGLVEEALDAMDPDVLYGGYRGVRSEHLDYYELMRGTLLERVTRRGPVEAPRASVVVPLCGERGLLAGTLRALSRQDMDAMEVICVDCAASEEGRRVAQAYAERDQRFRVASAGGASRSDGIRAGVEEARAQVTIVLMPGEVVEAAYVRRLAEALSEGAAEMALCGGAGEVASSCNGGDGTVEIEGFCAEIATARGFSLGCCAFGTKFLRNCGALSAMGECEDGASLALGALCRASRVAVARVSAPTARSERGAFGGRMRSDLASYELERESLEDVLVAVRGLGDDAERTLRCYAAKRLREALLRYAGSDEGRRVFADVARLCRDVLGIWDAPRISFCNQDDLLALELALSSPYEDVLRADARRLRERGVALSRKLASVRGSRSYQLGNALVGLTKRVMPSGIIRRFRG